jgi:hypothetical protein
VCNILKRTIIAAGTCLFVAGVPVRGAAQTAPEARASAAEAPATTSDFARPDQQQRDVALVPNGGDGAPVNQVTEQPMAVGRHRNQVTLFLHGGFQNLVWWIA